MATNKLIIKLTADQQKQIKDATGRSVSELTMRLTDSSCLADEDLDKISGGESQSIGSQTMGAGAGKVTFNPF